jgi:hypothetical protein
MTLRAYIHEPFSNLSGLQVVIANQVTEQLTLVMRIEDGNTFWDEYDTTTGEAPKPTFVFAHETGRLLLDALTRHYQGAEDTRQLRHDYERERTRGDAQAKALAEVAVLLAGKAGAR